MIGMARESLRSALVRQHKMANACARSLDAMHDKTTEYAREIRLVMRAHEDAGLVYASALDRLLTDGLSEEP